MSRPLIPACCCLSFFLLLPNAGAGTPALPVIPTNIFNITSYGAVGDGVTTNTTAISNTIAAAGAAGGGTVEIPAGTFLSGPFTLTNKLNLQLDAGAILRALPYGSYPLATNATSTNFPTFILATNVHDLEISGTGTLDGQGAAWWAAFSSNSLPASRPLLVQVLDSSRILIQNVFIQNAPATHVTVKGISGNLTIRGVNITTPAAAPDNTGIDMAATNALIANNSIAIGGDDDMQVGSSTAPAIDVVITNCAFGAGHGLSIGSQVAGGVSNLLVIDCSFNGTQNGIRLKTDRDRGGVVQKLFYYNLTMTSVRVPISISSYYNSFTVPNNVTPAIAATNTVLPVTNTTPVWRDITISNLTATTQSGYPAGVIWGRPELTASNFTLAKININASKSFNIYNARGIRFVDSQLTLPGGVPAFTLFNAGVILTNSTPAAGVAFDGLANTNNANTLALYNASASLSNTNPLAGGTVTLQGSTFAINNNFALGNSNIFSFILGGGPSLATVTGNLVLGGRFDITAVPGFGPGTYTLFTYAGSLSGSLPVIGAKPPGYYCSLSTNTPGQVNLVVGTQTSPTITGISVSGTNFIVQGYGGLSNQYYWILTSTNIALPLSNWTRLATNPFDATGGFVFSNKAGIGVPQQFYRLQLP